MSEDFIATKLMDVIRVQMPTANLPSLKSQAKRWFPYIEKCLKKYNLPEDLKYLPIVESGFANRQSGAGASGFWQLMPPTATDYGLMVNKFLDERDDPVRATDAACRVLRDYYKKIKTDTKNESWILTAAAYNIGIGRIIKAVRQQGGNYFAMNLNPETAEYVYKLIAIKELFENPEIYMKGFGKNVFTTSYSNTESAVTPKVVSKDFEKIKIVDEKDEPLIKKEKQIYYVPAHIIANDDGFRDGKMVTIELDGDLEIPATFKNKGSIMKGTGWIIDDRIFVSMGYGHSIQIMDKQLIKGLNEKEINKDGNKILLQVEVN